MLLGSFSHLAELCISGPVKAWKRETPLADRQPRVSSNQNAVGVGRSLPPARCVRSAYENNQWELSLSAALTCAGFKLPPLHAYPRVKISRFLLQLPSDQRNSKQNTGGCVSVLKTKGKGRNTSCCIQRTVWRMCNPTCFIFTVWLIALLVYPGTVIFCFMHAQAGETIFA